MKKGKMAPMSSQNNLQVFDVSNNPELQLTELENQMLAPLLIFQKMKLLPKNRWNALVDRTVNVPILDLLQILMHDLHGDLQHEPHDDLHQQGHHKMCQLEEEEKIYEICCP